MTKFDNKYRNFLPIVLLLLLSLIGCNCGTIDATSSHPVTLITSDTTQPETSEASPSPSSPSTTTDLPSQNEPERKAFTWKISSNSTHVYLLGSIHVAAADIYPLPGVIEDAFVEADTLVVEININEVDEIESVSLILEYASYPPGEGLRDSLPEELYEKLETQFGEWGISLSLLDSYRPWFIQNLLEITSLEMFGYSSEYGIDLHFLDAAVSRELEILELETQEFQIGLLAEIPDDVMIRMLEMTLEEPIIQDDIVILFEIWETGDTAAMEEFLFEGLEEEPELIPYFESVFTNRNYTILEKIIGFLEDTENIYFIVVGAGHLVGEEGLLNLLEEAGYTVEQLEY